MLLNLSFADLMMLFQLQRSYRYEGNGKMIMKGE